MIRCAVWKNGNIIFHVYRMRWQRFLRELKPDVIYMNHEPYALATAQVCHANNRSIQVPFGFYSCQNINKQYPAPFSWLEKMVYRSSSFALPITDRVAEVLQAKGYRGRQTVCALPLDPERYHPRLRSAPPEQCLRTEVLAHIALERAYAALGGADSVLWPARFAWGLGSRGCSSTDDGWSGLSDETLQQLLGECSDLARDLTSNAREALRSLTLKRAV